MDLQSLITGLFYFQQVISHGGSGLKKFQLSIRIIYLIVFIVCFILFLLAPTTIALHFNEFGLNGSLVNSRGNRIALFVNPIILLVLSELFIGIERFTRKKQGIIGLPLITFQEWSFIAGTSFIGVVMVFLMWAQIHN